MIQIIYNNLYSYDNFGVIAKTIRRPLLPAKRHVEVTVPGRDGTYDFSDDTYENIIIPVVIQCIEDDFPNLRTRARRIAAWLGQKDYSPLIFTDEPDKYYLGKIYDEASLEKIVELAPGETTTVNFLCHPFAYSIDLDLLAELVTDGEEWLVINEGTRDVFPVITISPVDLSDYSNQAVEVTGALNPEDPSTTEATLVNPAITIGSNTLLYTGSLTSGQSLIIDRFKATKAGTNVLANISGEWPVLEPGNNVISLADTNSECGAMIKISFRKRWF